MKSLILKGLGWSALSQGAGQIQSVVFGAILARLIAPSEFGIMGMATTSLGIVTLFRLKALATLSFRNRIAPKHTKVQPSG